MVQLTWLKEAKFSPRGKKDDTNDAIDAEKNAFEEVVIERITAASIKVPMEVNDQRVKAVIDTGAEVTVLNESIFFLIPEPKRPILKPAKKKTGIC